MEVCVKEAIFKEFWNRYDEFVHLMNISLMMNDIKRYIDNIYNDLLDSKLIVEYFVSDFVYNILYFFIGINSSKELSIILYVITGNYRKDDFINTREL